MALLKKDLAQIKGVVHDEIKPCTNCCDGADIRKHFVYRDEFEDVLMRLSAVEKKLGIKSGK